ncbi:MAG TPA: YncE family protein [Rhizomicrobium sp.]|jgi:YVTN family beta-propeller protein
MTSTLSTRFSRLVAVAGLALLPVNALAADATQPALPYKLEKTIPLGDGERWDYVTYASGRAYVAHGDHVSVVDLAKGAVIGEIGTMPGGTHGIGISGADGVGFTDDGKAGVAVAFDLQSLKVLKQIPAAPDADGIVFDPVSRHIFVIEGDSGTISVIDPKTRSSIATIKIGAALEAGVVDGKGKLFVDGAANHDIVAIDTATNAVTAHFAMPGCVGPHGIAVDAENDRIFATCANKVMVVVNAKDGTNIATLPIGGYNDGAVFDPARKLALSANGDGTLTVVAEKDADHFAIAATVPTALSARTIAIDPASGRLYLPAADIAKIDPPAQPGGRPHVSFVPHSFRLLVFAPTP